MQSNPPSRTEGGAPASSKANTPASSKANADGNGALLNLNDGYLHVAGVGGIGTNMGWDITKSHLFAPRVGLAYQLNEKTVVRAGYGRSFAIGVFGSIFGHAATQNLPVLANQAINNATFKDSAFTLDVGPTAPTPTTVPANGLLPNAICHTLV